ncbi:hypothetical protein QBC37DRAFT_50974 [Rhypophila decipiens]|uniref:C2H2-type domain-containing protein n=1 Tax=Rhypophila decipiens TaxID=261697 RepID=A0AAN6Y3M9_9PEZI|nr:hypothetical protein QBC37DRAFT_50974 [Rhypophila decipiens]
MSLQNTPRSRTAFQTRPQSEQQLLYQYIHQQQQLANLNAQRQNQVPYQNDLTSGIDLDFDADRKCQSLSASPISTQSLLSQYSAPQAAPLSAFDSIPTIAVPRVTQDESLFDISNSNTSDLGDPWLTQSDLMQTETWLSNGQLTPRSTGRVSHHQRESSLSSLGSTTGPASPYTQNTSNPHIALESAGDVFHGLPNTDELNNYELAKFPIETYYGNFSSYAPADNTPITFPNLTAAPKRRNDRGLLQPEIIGQSRSRPLSVASTITAGDSPATPSGEPEDNGRQKLVVGVPKLERTMTDVLEDQLWAPIPSTSSGQVPRSPHNDLFAQRLQAANQHLGVVQQSPVSAVSRDRSPFRQNSPLAPAPMQDFSTMSSQVGFPSAQQIRERNKAVMDLQEQMARSNAGTSTPQTISPQEALLEFHDADADSNFTPLFPQQNATGYNTGMNQKSLTGAQGFGSLNLGTNGFNYVPPLSTGLQAPQIPQHYPFIAQPRQQSTVPSLSTGSLGPSRMGSTETGTAESSHTNSPQRPATTSADGGTYTCTYHGCTLRFETPALLQKHKREGHRQAHGINGSRRADVAPTGMTSSLLNSQAGPHRCDRINPSTGKPCNTVFSRPYDLTRHEDTIHNARKQKVRCDLCTDEKTFSRADALTRHYRVCHPDVEFPGKHRRRGGHGG